MLSFTRRLSRSTNEPSYSDLVGCSKAGPKAQVSKLLTICFFSLVSPFSCIVLFACGCLYNELEFYIFQKQSKTATSPHFTTPAHPLFTSRDQLVGEINQWHCRLLMFCWHTKKMPLVKIVHVTYSCGCVFVCWIMVIVCCNIWFS